MKLMRTDESIIYEYAGYKNVKKTTINEYKIAVQKYITHQNKSFTSLIKEAEKEEENGVRWKNSKIKQRLTEFRQYLYTNYSKNTARTYFIKIKALYKFKEITIGDLPSFNMKNVKTNVPLTYNDLPTPEILLEAINQSNPLIKAYILFACSSGCAVNEITHLTI